MASPKDVIRHQLLNSQMILEKLTRDLSDEEYFTPAVPDANHAGWILGHIAVSEDFMVGKITGTGMRLPKTTHERFNGRSQCYADPTKYPARKEIDEMFRVARARTIEGLTSFNENKWGDQSPEGVPKDFFPTLGAIWSMIGTHSFWHIGQIATNRTALKKPRVLG